MSTSVILTKKQEKKGYEEAQAILKKSHYACDEVGAPWCFECYAKKRTPTAGLKVGKFKRGQTGKGQER
jgi:hypothetical protein